MATASWKNLTNLLERTSRSFYLTLRVLPGSVREQIGLAYLLARATDTIADTELVPAEKRLAALDEMRRQIRGERLARANLRELIQTQTESAERELLERRNEAMVVLETGISTADQKLIRQLLEIIISGQELDLKRFAGGSSEKIVALQSEGELDDYTYRVAGCVGEFWTKICRAHVFPRAHLDDAQLLRDGVRFGKGLQLVNILRDLPGDLRKGRCYLPETVLAQVGLRPLDLLAAANEKRLRPVYDQLVTLAEDHLKAGWAYTNSLPWSCVRVRLACAWPVLIGVKTLARLRVENPLDATRPIKIARADVKSVMRRSILLYPFPGAWRQQASLPR
jgi:farnesyl-diphosphate farnesyltransferase